jgi:hypothetical protein
MKLDNICKFCGARIFAEKLPEKRHYHVPPVVKDAWKAKFGKCPLGPFYKVHCEVCGKYMAVFDRPKGELAGENIVLFMCTFADCPAVENCKEYGNCYNCPVPKEQRERGIRKYY